MCSTSDSNVNVIPISWVLIPIAFDIVPLPEKLAGCIADGASYEKALQNVHVIIDEWIETAKSLGRPIPTPRGKLMYA